MASQDNQVQPTEPTGTISKTTSSAQLPELEVPAYTSLSSQLGAAIWSPQSPLTPSPEGSAEITTILQRLESIEVESRELLTRLFSMVDTDARLERYIRRRLQDDRLSKMWELVEQILDTRQGSIDVDTILQQQPDYSKELKESASDGAGGGGSNERFRVRQFDKDNPGGADELPTAPPLNPPPTSS